VRQRFSHSTSERLKSPHQRRVRVQNGTRTIMKEMEDYSAMKSYQEKNNLHYYTFSPNFDKPIKAVIRYLP
jgi:hypothetical protein